MPWTPAQIRFFQIAGHNPQIAAAHGASMAKFRAMSHEGVKRSPKEKVAAALMQQRTP